MKLLIDTSSFIWWDSEPEKLSITALNSLLDRTNTILLSVVSVWEMQIKSRLGKLQLQRPLAEIVASQQQTNNIQILSIDLAHVLALDKLPTSHKDPFDRLLVAQADVENAVLVSSDHIFQQYPVNLLW